MIIDYFRARRGGVVAVFEGGSRYQQTHGVAEKQGPGETSLTKGFDPFMGIEML